ncbi:SPASM domain-containing protein [Candidatus Collierbacteria bacterium]|nr:SPASM domain-containing protein [Candidatus Collierbacteria bacterium]
MSRRVTITDVVLGNPYLVQVNLLTDCIYRCDYCYLKELRDHKEQFLPLSRLKKFIKKFAVYKKLYGLELCLNLTGGDLWLHPEIGEVFNFVSLSPIVVKVGLMINSLWSDKSRDLILEIKPKLSSVQLNIDALLNREEDLVWLSNQGIRRSVKILLSQNRSYFQTQLITLKSLVKADPNLRVAVDRLCPVGVDQIGDVVNLESSLEMIDEIRNIVGSTYIEDDPLLLAVLIDKKVLPEDQNFDESLRGCAIPGGGTVIFPDGSIKLCARIPDFSTGFEIENFDLIKYVTKFSKVKKVYRKCSSCKLQTNCLGGCPASSYIANGYKIGADINCPRYA